MAESRGTFPAFNNSTYDKENERFRNHCRLTVAPTGTISMIADTASGIEPTFALVWKKQNILDGQSLNYVNKYFEADAKEYNFYSEDLMTYLASGGSLKDASDTYNIPDWVKDVYATAPEISPEAHVLMQSAFQKYVDSGISKTINFSNSASIKDVEDAYMLAWKSNCKGITVYRAGSREKEVLVKGVKNNKAQLEFSMHHLEENRNAIQYNDENCCDMPNIIMESGCETCKSCGWSACKIA